MISEDFILEIERAVKDQVQRNPEALNFMGGILNRCEDILGRILGKLNLESYPDEISYKEHHTIAHLSRAIIRLGRAVNLLCLLGYSDCAFPPLRSILEDFFDLKLMTMGDRHPKQIMSWHLLDVKRKLWQTEMVEKSKIPQELKWLKERLVADKAKNEEDFNKNLNWLHLSKDDLDDLWGKKLPRSPREIAEKCHEESKYYVLYSLLSSLVHGGPTKIHKKIFDITGRTDSEIEKDEIDDIAFIILDIVVPTLNVLFENFPSAKRDEKVILKISKDFLDYYKGKNNGE